MKGVVADLEHRQPRIHQRLQPQLGIRLGGCPVGIGFDGRFESGLAG
jgi:hypothetical protein